MPSSTSRLRTVGLVLGGVALGVGVAVGASAFAQNGEAAPSTFGRTAAPEGSAPLLDPARLAGVEGERTRADSPTAAVEAFLSAEVDGDHATSFGYLADQVRVEYGSPAAWAADHPDALPPVTGFTLESADDSSTVVTQTRYQSSLDSVSGLVPARARTSWVTVEEDGGWAVDVSATTQQALLPPDADAVPAVQEWAQQLQACEAPEQAVSELRARADLASRLCGADGEVRATGVAPLAQFDAAPLQTSFGADVVSWARAVTLEGAVPLRAVVAPVDDRWTVIGVLAPSGAGQ